MKSLLITQILPEFYRISSDWSGTHSMQRLIELLSIEEELQIVRSGIEGRVIDFATQGQATHVLQKVILCFPETHIDYIFGPVLENLLMLSNDQNGLCVVKKVISSIKSDGKRSMLSKALGGITKECVQDPYGNYAIQHAVEVWGPPHRDEIVGTLLRGGVQLSSTKYSSNVVEKCIELLPKDFALPFARAVLKSDAVLLQLLNNLFGTFVLQKLLEWVPAKEVKSRLGCAVQANLKNMADKSLRGKWEGFFKTNSPKRTDRLSVKLNLGAQSFSSKA